ncbi:MAG TPA: hypothetical protein VK807_23270 [Gemmatimonadaceae bacterium]|nr:hypothetical protein [Gemmatimonadaceae bacterium]
MLIAELEPDDWRLVCMWCDVAAYHFKAERCRQRGNHADAHLWEAMAYGIAAKLTILRVPPPRG